MLFIVKPRNKGRTLTFKEISAREWTISFADGDITIGGLAAVS
jgi:hypothetical protein